MIEFDDLAAKREDYVRSAQLNGFDEGIRRLLSELYPDNAHFIYELLQNAEDADAKQVIFDLRDDGLRVEHDGTRLFSLLDIQSITGISQTAKKDEGTSIGKFGVGFKAVFAYTQRPVVLSGEYAFAIRDMFVPEAVEEVPRPGWTSFWFAFDRPEKPAPRAVEEVTDGLCDLNAVTLLFLTNLSSIMCILPTGQTWTIEREHLTDNIISITRAGDVPSGEEGPAHWYRITDVAEVQGSRVPIGAAFSLVADKTERESTPHYAVRADDGQVFVYFPAASEYSGLRFHIHAAFATTVARNSVRDDEANDEAIQIIAEMICGQLPAMRDEGLVTDGLLASLPNKQDNLPSRYAVIRDAVIGTFATNALTPVHGNRSRYEPSASLLRTTPAIRRALTPDDANFLRSLSYVGESAEPAIDWLPQRSGTAQAFLDSLPAERVTDSDLMLTLAYLGYDQAKCDVFVDWLSTKDDTWLRGLYALVGGFPWESYWRSIDRIPIVRVVQGDGVDHVAGGAAFLPAMAGTRIDGLVPDTIAPLDTSDADKGNTRQSEALAKENDALRAFFRATKTPTWNAAAQLKAKFESYASRPPEVRNKHLTDLRGLVKALDSGATTVTALRGLKFLVGIRSDGTRAWVGPSDAFLDTPLEPTGLSALYEASGYRPFDDLHQFHYKPKIRLDPEYERARELILTISARFDVVRRLDVSPVDPIWNWQLDWSLVRDGRKESHLGVMEDWDLPWLELICEVGDEILLRDLWRLACAQPRSRLTATYQKNSGAPRHTMESQLVQRLRQIAWVLDRDGNLRTPAQMTVADLPDDVRVPADSTFLDKVGFGLNARSAEAERAGTTAVLQSVGFDDPELARTVGNAIRKNPSLADKILELVSGVDLPEGASADPENRADRAAQAAASAHRRESKPRLRAVRIQVPGHLSSAKQYLRSLYTNDDGVMVCQICDQAMPFRLEDGFYFEAVQFVRDSGRDLTTNRLALCPTCGAKFRHALSTPLSDLRDALLALKIGTSPSVDISLVLAGRRARIRFVGKHAIDLREALKVTADDPIEEDDEFTPG